jgi:hypothetical protein
VRTQSAIGAERNAGTISETITQFGDGLILTTTGDIMHAHKARAIVSENREVRLSLPSDFPPGDVDIIVMSAAADPSASPSVAKTEVSSAFAERYPHAGTLGPILFHGDPREPLDPSDWGENLS